MKISKIITTPPRDEYIDQHQHKFDHLDTLTTIRELQFKKYSNGDEISYGLLNRENQLVGYFELEYQGDGIWMVMNSQLAQAYKGMDYATFLYDYAVMNDKLKVMSDATNTGGIHGSRRLWLRLIDNARYTILGYDVSTHRVIPDATPEMIYNNQPNTRWLALPSNETINESLERIQSLMKDRYVVWYGPGTTTEDYFNY